MVSLSKFCEVTEDGVTFEHPETGEKMFRVRLRARRSCKLRQICKCQIACGSKIFTNCVERNFESIV